MSSMSQRLVRALSNTAQALVVVIVLWFAALWAFNIKAFIGKNPFDVYNFLFSVPAAGENRELVMKALGQTMIDASIGFVVGMFFATLISVLFSLSKGIEQALMPLAMLLRRARITPRPAGGSRSA